MIKRSGHFSSATQATESERHSTGSTDTECSDELKQVKRELARVSEELTRCNADLDQFASIVSHDLRSPLLSMTGCVELLTEQYRGQLGADADELIGFITSSVQRLNDMIKSLLDYSRVGTRPLTFGECDLNLALDGALKSLHGTIRETGAQVGSDPLPTIRADATRMQQLFENLVDNAIKYRGEALPRVHVSGEQDAEFTTISIQDNGLGIAPEHTTRIFRVFGRLHGEDSPYKGTGVGLAICKKIVERHGGRIWAESEPGKGTALRFTVPSS